MNRREFFGRLVAAPVAVAAGGGVVALTNGGLVRPATIGFIQTVGEPVAPAMTQTFTEAPETTFILKVDGREIARAIERQQQAEFSRRSKVMAR